MFRRKLMLEYGWWYMDIYCKILSHLKFFYDKKKIGVNKKKA